MNAQEIILGLIVSFISGIKRILIELQKILPQGLIGEVIILGVSILLGYFLFKWIINPKTRIYLVTIVLGLIIYLLLKLGMLI